MKTLKDVAGLYKTLAQTYMVSGPWRPAYKTGNLYRQVGDYNSATQMIQNDAKGRVTLVLDYAPPAAYYGRYVQDGTYKMEARPFAQYAANSDALKAAIDEYVKSEAETIVNKMGSRLSVSLNKLG